MSFAAAEARASASVIGRLGNATATVVEPADAAGASVDGIFDAAYLFLDVAGGFQSDAPAFSVQDGDLPIAMADALAAGEAVTLQIRGCSYNVVEPKPDGTGLTVLRLRK